jgi:phosphonate degradation associated HDIG domain protein
MTVADEVFDLFERHGHEMYFGEDVSVLEHSLQAAALASRDGAPGYLVVAALLHDVGHLLHDLPEDIAAHGIDGRHETVGEQWLRSRFGPEVSEPVLLHVEAKRYLCAVEPEYLAKLSPSSVQSLALQGGVLSAAEIENFERNSGFRDAVSLRRWDDGAKEIDANTPELRTYRALIDSVSQARSARS